MHDMPHWHRFRNNLRLIDSGADEGGSGDPATGDPADTGEDIDWKAKFEEQRAHSRKWEQRAKDNSKAAEELQQFKDSQLSEAEKAAKRIKELEAANAPTRRNDSRTSGRRRSPRRPACPPRCCTATRSRP